MKTKLKSEQREIIQLLKQGIDNFNAISEIMGYRRQAIMHHVLQLEELGIIQIDRTNWKKVTAKSVKIISEEV